MAKRKLRVILFVCFVVTHEADISATESNDPRPNIVLISIDDLNDWVGCLNGHPQSNTPNLDSLADGGTLFANAHCQAPVCMPSRASLMTSRWPTSTGLYFLNPGLRDSAVTRDVKTIPERFADDGYTVLGGGKLFHNQMNRKVFSRVGTYAPQAQVQTGFGPRPDQKINQPQGHPLWDWGPFPDRDQMLPDFQLAQWASKQLEQPLHQPFLLAAGFYRPHVPMYVPQKWFDMHPISQIKLPLTRQDDTNDLPQFARDLTTLQHVAPTHQWIQRSGQWPKAVQAYLASTTFVDQCVGTLIDALEASQYRKNTVIVVFSDHGFHLGEKNRWAKRSLWEDSTRVPLIFKGPKIKAGAVCRRPVGLIDVFPTLLELCAAEPDPDHEGLSLVPLLTNPETKWSRPILTSFGPGNHAVRSDRWRFIQYADGSRELYDHATDPHEWHNLSRIPEYAETIDWHVHRLPKTERPALGSNSTGHKAFAAARRKLPNGK